MDSLELESLKLLADEPIDIKNCFHTDKKRFINFSRTYSGLLFDFSKQKITNNILESLLQLAVKKQLPKAIQDLFSGKKINISENRPALHTVLRATSNEQVIAAREKVYTAVENINSGAYKGATGKTITDVISVGIGGSDLGPIFITDALNPNIENNNANVHFISNADNFTLNKLLDKLSFETTICIINSKTFTTIETLYNADILKKHWELVLGKNAICKHFWAVTSEIDKAKNWGVTVENIFPFWDWVGGRFSIWSAIGLSAAIKLGVAAFEDLLAGARELDEHFKNTELIDNIPVLMALIGIWNRNFLNYPTLAVIPYSDRLRFLPSYLQQLEMESNGKRVDNLGEKIIKHNTVPVIWGSVGCNAQHAYLQCLHQGTDIIPVDFILAAEQQQHELLIASCLSQSKALMEGEIAEPAYECPGNRPSSTLVIPKLTPNNLGKLIAIYEHKVFVQGVIWGINSFDQWGVQLGKKLLSKILPIVNGDKNTEILDQSSQGILNFLEK